MAAKYRYGRVHKRKGKVRFSAAADAYYRVVYLFRVMVGSFRVFLRHFAGVLVGIAKLGKAFAHSAVCGCCAYLNLGKSKGINCFSHFLTC